jgi:hypothetical protein
MGLDLPTNGGGGDGATQVNSSLARPYPTLHMPILSSKALHHCAMERMRPSLATGRCAMCYA